MRRAGKPTISSEVRAGTGARRTLLATASVALGLCGALAAADEWLRPSAPGRATVSPPRSRAPDFFADRPGAGAERSARPAVRPVSHEQSVPVLAPVPAAGPAPIPEVPDEPTGRGTLRPAPAVRESAAPRPGANPAAGASPRVVPEASPGFGTPQADEEARRRAARYVADRVDPQLVLDVQQGRPTILRFRQAPFRDQVADPETVGLLNVTESEYSLTGRKLGSSVVNFWFRNPEAPGGQEVLSYLVRVGADPEELRRVGTLLSDLEREVNRAFPDSAVHLRYVGSQVVVGGQAKDVEEATQILRIVSRSVAVLERAEASSRPDELLLGGVRGNEIVEAGGLQGFLQGDTATGINNSRINSRIVNLLRVSGVHQVMLKVTVAEVNRSAVRRASANLIVLFGNTAAFTSFGSLMRLAGGAFETLGGAGGSIIVDRGDFDLILNFLKTHQMAKALAEPTLTTLNGQSASFQVGGSFPVPDNGLSGGDGTGGTGQTVNFVGGQSVRFVPFGVQLDFQPTVTDRNRIRLRLATSVSARDDSSGTNATIGNTDVPSLTERQFTNVVELREGQTLAVAGLIQNNLGAESDRVPFLGDVPVLGRLFSRDRTSYDEQELIVLVTPYLVNPVDADREPRPLPGSDYYEPDDVEFYVFGSLTGHVAEDYRSAVRTDIHKMKAFRRLEQQIIVGRPGHSNGLLCPPVSPARPR